MARHKRLVQGRDCHGSSLQPPSCACRRNSSRRRIVVSDAGDRAGRAVQDRRCSRSRPARSRRAASRWSRASPPSCKEKNMHAGRPQDRLHLGRLPAAIRPAPRPRRRSWSSATRSTSSSARSPRSSCSRSPTIVAQNKMPTFSLAGAEDMTQRKANPYRHARLGDLGAVLHPMGDYAAKELKFKRASRSREDFAFGYEQMAGFQRVFEDGGGKVVKKLWPPLVTPDYTPSSRRSANVDGVFNGFAGSNPLRFMRTYADARAEDTRARRLDRVRRRADAQLRRRGGRASSSAVRIRLDLDTPSNKRFVAAMQKDYGVAARRLLRRHLRRRPVRRGGDWRSPAARPTTARRSSRRCTRSRSTDTPRGADQVRPATATSSATSSSAAARSKDGKLRQHDDQDLSERQPVLDLRREGVPDEPGLFARLSAGEESEP